jgi:DNA-binding transcriptional LysR family regulator
VNAFVKLRHLEIASSGVANAIGGWLAECGLPYNVVHRAPFLAAADILEQSDMVAIQRLRVAKNFIRRVKDLEIWEPPCESPVVPEFMLWPRRLDNVPAHRWLRNVIVEVCRNLA